MEIYKITKIEEGFYGCEECSEEGAAVLLTLEGDNGAVTVEEHEGRLAAAGLDTGCPAVIAPDGKILKYLRVAAALITDDNGRVLAAKRSSGEFKDMWEFPGGKIEKGESSAEAVVREVREELGVDIEPKEFFCTVEYDYPLFHLSMDCFICTVAGGSPIPREHSALRMLAADELDTVEWLPADMELTLLLKQYLTKRMG